MTHNNTHAAIFAIMVMVVFTGCQSKGPPRLLVFELTHKGAPVQEVEISRYYDRLVGFAKIDRIYDGFALTESRGMATFSRTYKNHHFIIKEPQFVEVYVHYNWKSQRFEARILPNETVGYETDEALRIPMTRTPTGEESGRAEKES